MERENDLQRSLRDLLKDGQNGVHTLDATSGHDALCVGGRKEREIRVNPSK